jgi:hypothetical protein
MTLLGTHRMSKAQYLKLGLDKVGEYNSIADFDEFLQADPGPEADAFAAAHGYQPGSDFHRRTLDAAVKGVKGGK